MQVPDQIRKCVAFACLRNSEGAQLAGTVFFVAVQSREVGFTFGYAITAKHVIAGIQQASIDHKVLLRVNMKVGPSQFVETDASDWRFHPDDPSVDVAVLPLWLPQDSVDFLPLPVEMAATEEVIQEHDIGIGDDVFLTGLFVNHYGQQKNLPILRVGNIALMPEEKVETADLGAIDAYLVEARSVGGLSGSPVFVHLGVTRAVRGRVVSETPEGHVRFALLGLMHGHWDRAIPGHDLLAEDIFNQDRVNMGIAIVVPVSKILEVINQEVFVKARNQEIEERRKDTLPRADSQLPDMTQEEFEKTLKQVSRPIRSSEPAQEESGT